MTGMHPDDNRANQPSTDQIELETFPNKDIIYGTHLRFERISLEHGLSQSHVLSMTQDNLTVMLNVKDTAMASKTRQNSP